MVRVIVPKKLGEQQVILYVMKLYGNPMEPIFFQELDGLFKTPIGLNTPPL